MINLLQEMNNEIVQKTQLSRKLTIDGVTNAYPVYRVRLDQLFYNDQNDRIATWMSQYKSEYGDHAFREMSREAYNSIIEQFIIQSNESAIEKTQMNIALVHQREPGVILADGRVIDGNRRFTCLRRLSKEKEEFNWFETVILDTSMEADKKQIKMLELAIQHGEEKKIDYNPIDRLVGIYQDIIETELLTVEEYAYSTNETVYEVKKRLEAAMLMIEFLEYINMPKQYHIARDYQIVSVISDLQTLLHRCATLEMQQRVKNVVFTNIFMKTIGDSRKYIRELGQMMSTGFFATYIKDQERIAGIIHDELEEAAPKDKGGLDFFVNNHEDAAETLQLSLDKSLLKARKHETRNRPSRIVSKSITLLKDVDTNIFEKLTENEKENLRGQITRLSAVVDRFDEILDEDESNAAKDQQNTKQEEGQANTVISKTLSVKQAKPRFYIAKRHIDEPILECLTLDQTITSLSITLEFRAGHVHGEQKTNCTNRAFFIDENNEVISDIKELYVSADDKTKVTFLLSPVVTSQKQCFLAIQSQNDSIDELQQLIPYKVDIAFNVDFGF